MAKLFRVLDLKDKTYILEGDTPSQLAMGSRNWHGPVKVFTDEISANEAALQYTLACGRKFQLRLLPVSSTEWHDREVHRFIDGTYTPLPWNGFSVNDVVNIDVWRGWAQTMRRKEAAYHFPHVSTKSPGNIAFTENDSKGAADVQTTMKPGRYLTRFYPSLGEEAITKLANEMLVKYGRIELLFATTEDEFEAVYTNGPSSCMSHKATTFDRNGGYHPVRIYAAGDLALAYLHIKIANDDDGGEEDGIPRASARALCWPAKKRYGRIYGDVQKMQHLLNKQGYRECDGWDFSGAKLLKRFIPGSNTSLVMPYLDGNGNASDRGDHLVWDTDGPIKGDNTSGYAEFTVEEDEEDEESPCACCERMFLYVEMSTFRVHPGIAAFVPVCESCEDNEVFECGYSGTRFFAPNHSISMADGNMWHSYYVERYAFLSSLSGEYFNSNDRVTMGDGSYWAQSEVDECAVQSATGAWWPKDSLRQHRDGRMLHPSEMVSDAALDTLLQALNEDYLALTVPPLGLPTDRYVALEAEAQSPFALPPEGEH